MMTTRYSLLTQILNPGYGVTFPTFREFSCVSCLNLPPPRQMTFAHFSVIVLPRIAMSFAMFFDP